jgi:D-alanine transaminase
MWAWVNGEFVRRDQPGIRLEDRGLTFADGLFEVLRTVGGKVLFWDEHLARIRRSARFLGIAFPFTDQKLAAEALELIRRNDVTDGELYLELTRGADPYRQHKYPPSGTEPTLFMLSFPLRTIDAVNWERGATLLTYPDLRHRLCEHKTINLLANVLAKNYAYERGGYEALMCREDARGSYITEGGSSNYFCCRGGRLLTPEIDNIMPGITRAGVIDHARRAGIEVVERRLYLNEFLGADEAFLTSTVSKVMPIRAVDYTTFPAPGPVTRRLMDAFEELIHQELAR